MFYLKLHMIKNKGALFSVVKEGSHYFREFFAVDRKMSDGGGGAMK